MRKIFLVLVLAIFFISFTSATASYGNWRVWNGTGEGDFILLDVGSYHYNYCSFYRWNATGKITQYYNYAVSGPMIGFNSSTVVNDSFGLHIHFLKYDTIRLNITQPIIGDNLTIIWEYANHYRTDTWSALNITNNTCGNFTSTGICEVGFVKPTTDFPNRDNKYLQPIYPAYRDGYTIRARVLNATGITQEMQLERYLKFKGEEIRINVGDTYTPATLYALDQSEGWGCIEKVGSYTYHSHCDLDIRGTFNINEGQVFSIGDMGGRDANHNAIFMPLASSTLQLGEKCGDHACKTGTLIYGNGGAGTPYLYWTGNLNLYGGLFFRYGYGYAGFAFYGLIIDWVDTTIASYVFDTLFFNSGSGNITNTNIMASVIYFYVKDIKVDGMYVNQGNIQGGGINFVLFSNQKLITLNKYDTSSYAAGKIYLEHGTKVALENSNMINDRMHTEYGSHSYMKGFLDLHDLKLKVIDENGNSIEDAIVKINNSNNFSALTLISGKLSTPIKLYGNWGPTTNVSSCVPTNCSSSFNIGDKILRFGELDEVIAVDSTTVTFERNITGSFTKEDAIMYCQSAVGSCYPLIVYDDALTDADGDLLKDGNYYQLLTGLIYSGGTERIYDLDIFNFEISKEGYETQKFTLNVTQELGDDWDKPFSLTISLSQQETPAPASLVLDKIISLNQIENETISYNITLRLTNKGGSNSTNTNITDSDSEDSPYDLGNITNGTFITRSYLENFTRNSTTYTFPLSVSNVSGIDSLTENLISENSTSINLVVPSTETGQQLTLIKNAFYNSENSTSVNYTITIEVVNSGGEDLTSITVLDSDLDLNTLIDLNRTESYNYSNFTIIDKAASNTQKTFAKSTATVNSVTYSSNQVKVSIPGYGGPADVIVYAPALVQTSTSFNTLVTVENQNLDIGQDFTVDYWISNNDETANYSSGQQTIYVSFSSSSNLTATLTSPSSAGTYKFHALVSWVGGVATAFDSFTVTAPSEEEPSGSGGITGGTTEEIVCNSPYIRYGKECCLDVNNNSICDLDEEKLFSEEDVSFEPKSEPKSNIWDKIKPYLVFIIGGGIFILLFIIILIKLQKMKNFLDISKTFTIIILIFSLIGIFSLGKNNITGFISNEFGSRVGSFFSIFYFVFFIGILGLLTFVNRKKIGRIKFKRETSKDGIKGLTNKKVYTETGEYLGKVEGIILGDCRIDSLKIRLSKLIKKEKRIKNEGIFVKYKDVRNTKHIVIVDKRVSKYLKKYGIKN